MYTYCTVCVRANLHTHTPKGHSGGLVPPPMTIPQGPRALPYKLHTWLYTAAMRMGQGGPATSQAGLVKLALNEVSACVLYMNIACYITGPHTRPPSMLSGQSMAWCQTQESPWGTPRWVQAAGYTLGAATSACSESVGIT